MNLNFIASVLFFNKIFAEYIFNTIKLNDYDTTDTYVNATVLVHGFVREDRLIVVDETNGTVAKLDNDMIYVMAK